MVLLEASKGCPGCASVNLYPERAVLLQCRHTITRTPRVHARTNTHSQNTQVLLDTAVALRNQSIEDKLKGSADANVFGLESLPKTYTVYISLYAEINAKEKALI